VSTTAAQRWGDFVTPATRPVHLEPLMPVLYLTPDSACPHYGPIRDGSGFVCMVCDHASKLNDRIIDRTPAPPPQDPEMRAARLKREIESGELSAAAASRAKTEIAILEAMVFAECHPTRYVPDPKLRGGVG
jgi:hypothetical protein